ncbi:MAG: hypothetical protein AB1351_03890 [Thermoproteota archaeon]
MASVLEIRDNDSLLRLSRQFLICDFCFWAASAISIRRHDVLACPQCNAEVSRIPLADNETFTFSYDNRRGVELDFASAR